MVLIFLGGPIKANSIIGIKQVSLIEYDEQLCSSELVIIRGDLAKLTKITTPELYKKGLKIRIDGAFRTLNWICRGVIDNNLNVSYLFKELEQLFIAKKFQELYLKLDFLIKKYPLNLDQYLPGSASKKDTKVGMKIYQHYCHGCHLSHNDQIKMPALSLEIMAKNLSSEEFIARMIAGVKGNGVIALRNPLSRKDISSIYSYLLYKE
ncbi:MULTISPECIES: hypothetical protein [Candidatus Thioglobus]|jgi:hypothetical protein|uniref:Cytochrome c domain-containing protein n=1 Tax=Candidatus Thioglobus autotrophicus TaxID=1705394 RepID=A0A0M4NI59_9GAMM|nr:MULTISPECIES: hypothetical protein [Candidatus Thioglobus]ALE53096.1 hypothetical protein SP60_07785 [Candidatus Thioglobus autotrophicus]MBT3276524.1 hypothetical protein [Candidatus Thioglobus sp.]MBT4181680.1 hypothetical protein [Candidatus Thioglobus sp.]MBT4421917.1 hypothetical protein [Candidatus Thioglobus sp.]MBT4747421.1 hypothetical protein [Candidatus Thioglobus sp.]